MEKIKKVLLENEYEIAINLIDKAKQGQYTRYTSTRMEDWIVSIREIAKGIIRLFEGEDGLEILH